MPVPPPLRTPMRGTAVEDTDINILFKYLRIYVTLVPHFLYNNLLIRSFIFSEINTFGLPKFSKISFAFNIFIPVEEMVYLKAIQKITAIDVSVSGTIDKKRI